MKHATFPAWCQEDNDNDTATLLFDDCRWSRKPPYKERQRSHLGRRGCSAKCNAGQQTSGFHIEHPSSHAEFCLQLNKGPSVAQPLNGAKYPYACPQCGNQSRRKCLPCVCNAWCRRTHMLHNRRQAAFPLLRAGQIPQTHAVVCLLGVRKAVGNAREGTTKQSSFVDFVNP